MIDNLARLALPLLGRLVLNINSTPPPRLLPDFPSCLKVPVYVDLRSIFSAATCTVQHASIIYISHFPLSHLPRILVCPALRFHLRVFGLASTMTTFCALP
jgi:hypothetical protein